MEKQKDVVIKVQPLEMVFTVNNPTIKTESNYFFTSRKNKCVEFLKKEKHEESDILEFLLNLHFVLEVGVNTFFRNYYKCFTNYDFLKGGMEIDKINFSDKIIIFLNENKFTLKNGENLSISRKKINEITGLIKNFNNIRNMIVHGHPVNEISSGQHKNQSLLKSKLNEESYMKQIEDFKKIISNINFFIDRLETTVRKDTIEIFQDIYLNLAFLDIKSKR